MKKFHVQVKGEVSDNKAWFSGYRGGNFFAVLPTDPAFLEKGLVFGPTPEERYVILSDLIEGAKQLRTIPVTDVDVISTEEIETPDFEKLMSSRPSLGLADFVSSLFGNLKESLEEVCDCPACTARREARKEADTPSTASVSERIEQLKTRLTESEQLEKKIRTRRQRVSSLQDTILFLSEELKTERKALDDLELKQAKEAAAHLSRTRRPYER